MVRPMFKNHTAINKKIDQFKTLIDIAKFTAESIEETLIRNVRSEINKLLVNKKQYEYINQKLKDSSSYKQAIQYKLEWVKEQFNSTMRILRDCLQFSPKLKEHLEYDERKLNISPQGEELLIRGWGDFLEISYCELFTSNGINSVNDALLISNAYFQSLKGSKYNRVFFRGEPKIGYDLLPRKGREFTESGQSITDPKKVTKEELEALQDFQNEWENIEKHADDVNKFEKIGEDNHNWWHLMQHYDRDYGTRLLDITSSIFIGLCFACIPWEGEINEDEDGILYLLINRDGLSWREMMDNPNEYSDKIPENVEDFFNIPDRYTEDTVRLYIPKYRNERQKAQGGAFLWWPKFNQPLRGTFKFLRFNGKAKKKILRELLSYRIGPDEIIFGEEGRVIYEKVMKDLFS